MAADCTFDDTELGWIDEAAKWTGYQQSQLWAMLLAGAASQGALNLYLRPDGFSLYRQPNGIDLYLRP